MKIILTGASGFIGSYLSSALLKENDVYAIGTQKNVNQIYSLKAEAVPYYYSDYSIDGLSQILQEVEPDALVNLAAKRLSSSIIEPNSYFANLNIAANMFEACLRNDLQNIVNLSTIGVYSSSNKTPWSESDWPIPKNLYALSKHLVESAARYYNEKGLHIKTLRLAQVIGLGEREGNVLHVYLKNAMHGLPIKVYGQCKGKRHYIYAKDVCRAIEAALALPEESGIYNIGMSRIYGFEELANTVNNVFGGKSIVVYDKAAKADESVYHMSIEKAKTKIFWQPQYNLYEAYLDMKKDIELHSLN